ncbi:hypothetical protein K9N50_07215 [bacterium]|nr:hypothetical protein [bacterium]
MSAEEKGDADSAQDLSLRELIGKAAENLHSTVQTSDNSYIVTVENADNDSYVTISLTGLITGKRGLSLEIVSGCSSIKTVNTRLQLIEISDLFITYDTPDLISFCYTHCERFLMVNILSEAKIEVWEGIDRRIGEESKPVDTAVDKRRKLFCLSRFKKNK